MIFRTDTSLHKLLASIFHNKQAVVFCGAGVSLEPPAGLPDWHKLRDYTLEAIATRDSFSKKYMHLLTETPMMSSPEQKGLTPEIVASTILKESIGYFESFKSLEEGEANVNHLYLAKMAKEGFLKYIVTTNFDLFIEQGLEIEKVPYKVYRTDEEFSQFVIAEEPCVHLLKIHGCISLPQTITATVEQEGKGLSLAKQLSLELLLTNYFFVFWGYSGADLKINLDYLKMVHVKNNAKGFIWNFLLRDNYKEQVNPYVAKLAEIYKERAHIVRVLSASKEFKNFF